METRISLTPQCFEHVHGVWVRARVYFQTGENPIATGNRIEVSMNDEPALCFLPSATTWMNELLRTLKLLKQLNCTQTEETTIRRAHTDTDTDTQRESINSTAASGAHDAHILVETLACTVHTSSGIIMMNILLWNRKRQRLRQEKTQIKYFHFFFGRSFAAKSSRMDAKYGTNRCARILSKRCYAQRYIIVAVG